MPVDITIEDVPEQLRDQLAALAASRHQSIEAFLLDEFKRMIEKPEKTKQEKIEHNRKIIQRARERLKNSNSQVTSEMIVESIRRARGVYDD